MRNVMYQHAILGLVWVLLHAGCNRDSFAQSIDKRDIRNAVSEIPDENYCDQPYLLKTNSGAWLCVMTTGPGEESNKGQHIVVTSSVDNGKTWSTLRDIEPSDGDFLSSWAVPYITPGGRVYVFYNYNGDEVTTLNGEAVSAGLLGWYCFRYSDDEGQTWSSRYRIDLPLSTIDLLNDFEGVVQRFWGVSKPFSIDDTMYVTFTKLGKFQPELERGEGWVMKSSNINSELVADSIRWEFLPASSIGIQSPVMGNVQEEHISVGLDDGSIYMVFRTNQGYIGETYSRDGGNSWSAIEHVRYALDGSSVKNPRACPRVFKCENGKYLLWHHNHGVVDQWKYRNPVWLSGGVERDGKIEWSQPELLFYDLDTNERISYPDLIEADGNYWFTETQKEIARVHQVDVELIEGLWSQLEGFSSRFKGTIGSAPLLELHSGMKKRPHLTSNQSFSVEHGLTLALQIDVTVPYLSDTIGTMVFNESGRLTLIMTAKNTIKLELVENDKRWSLETAPGSLSGNTINKVVFVLDNRAKVGWTLINGRVGDGGLYRDRGWEWKNQTIDRLIVDPGDFSDAMVGQMLRRLTVYGIPLRTSQIWCLEQEG